MHGSATFYFTLKFDSIAKLPYIFGWHDLNTDFFFFFCVGVGGIMNMGLILFLIVIIIRTFIGFY